MKKKGFTLIELLAVIVILAIIALIATPIVLDIIDDSKESSIKRSIELYGNAVEQAVASSQIKGSDVPSGQYKTTDGKTLTNGNTTIKVDYKGSKVVCDVYITTDGEVSLKNCIVNDKRTEYTYGKEEDVEIVDKVYTNGEVVYFDVGTGKACDNYTETQSNTGVNSGCMKFYAFNDDGGDKVNLLLDHNTTASVVWNSSGSNASGPNEVLTQLKIDTDAWQGTEIPSNYTMDQSSQSSKAKYTIDYSNYKARIITANEIAKITGNTSFNEETSNDNHYFFDTNTSTPSLTCYYNDDDYVGNATECKYGWLYDRASENCTIYGCLNNSDVLTNGYWTVTSSATGYSAWIVKYGLGNADSAGVLISAPYLTDVNNTYGLRPVIEVLKSKLN